MSQVTSESILTTKAIVEQAIKDYHKQILPYLNGEFPIAVVERFAPEKLYSTDEKIIGQWIDGKPLYQIVSSSPKVKTDGALFKPMMTDNSVPSPYVVTSSDLYNGNMQPYKAFDNARYLNGDPDFTGGKDYYYWMTSQIAGSWIKIDLGENNAKEFVNVGLGGIGASHINDLPRSFTISGSNDDNDYTVLYTSDPDRENSAGTDAHFVENFEFERTGQYRYYKLDVNTIFTGGDNVRVDCIKFYEAGQSIAPNIDKVLSRVHMGDMYVYQYTKVGDEPINIGSITDYSTTEKIVGTWIDGKPLYQKVANESEVIENIDLIINKTTLENVDAFTLTQAKTANGTINKVQIIDAATKNTVYSRDFSCSAYGVYSEVSDTFEYNDKTYNITSEGTTNKNKQSRVSVYRDGVLLCENWSVCKTGDNTSYPSSGEATFKSSVDGNKYIIDYTKTTD